MVYHHALPVGMRLASYEIRGVLGAGGFGITYKAYDYDLDRDVAIKEYLPTGLAVRIADGTTVAPKSEGDVGDFEYGRKRFLDEARTLARFRESNIVRVISYLEAHGTAYFVMEYEEGEALVDRLKTSVTLPEDDIQTIVVPILRGLRAVHQQSFLHRDIKPHNIYLRGDGSPVLIDFGAARMALGEHSRAMTGLVTPGYAPFEQYLSGGQGPWTDIYAIGATMYHCATGLAPVASTERVAAIHDGKPDPLLEVSLLLRGRYSAAFIDVIMHMMAPMARDRPQSVDEALAILSAGEAVAPRPSRGQEETIDLDAPVTASGARWQPETLKAVELNLEQHIGPLSRVLVQKAAGKTVNVAELTELLSRFIPTDKGKTAFIAETRAVTSGVPDASRKPRATAQETSKAAKPRAAKPGKVRSRKTEVRFDAELLQTTEHKLARYVGPVAKLLVKKAQATARDTDSLYELLAQELATAELRSAFLKDVGVK